MSPVPALAFEQLGTTKESVSHLIGFLIDHGAKAKDQGFFLEAISIRLYICEFYLRAMIVGHTAIDFDPKRNLTFGRLIDRAADCHLDADLLERLRRFNRLRNDAVHGMLEGRIVYDDLQQKVFESDASLPLELSNWLEHKYDKWSPKYVKGNESSSTNEIPSE